MKKWIHGAIAWNEGAAIHLIEVENDEYHPIRTLCGQKIPYAEVWHFEHANVDCKKCIKKMRADEQR